MIETEKALVLTTLNSRYPNGLPNMLKEFEGVTDADFIYGPYDIYAVIETETKKGLREIILKIRETDGIKSTMTCNVILR